MTTPTPTSTSPAAAGTTADVDDAPVTAAVSPALGADSSRDATAIPDAEPATASADDTERAAAPKPAVSTYRDGDGRVHYASPHSKATRQRVAAQEWTEVDPAEAAQPVEPFDPTGRKVREVIAHLVEHADDAEEVERVKAAEVQGEDRPTIRDWTPPE